MTLPRPLSVALSMMLAAVVFGQQQPEMPRVQNSVARPSLEGRKARLALLSQISSKSPSGSSFMAKVDDPIEVNGRPVLPKGPW